MMTRPNGLRKRATENRGQHCETIFDSYLWRTYFFNPPSNQKMEEKSVQAVQSSVALIRGPSTTDLSELMQHDNALWKIDFRETLNYIYI